MGGGGFFFQKKRSVANEGMRFVIEEPPGQKAIIHAALSQGNIYTKKDGLITRVTQ